MRNKVKFLTESGKKRMFARYGIIFDKTTRNVLRVHNKNESWEHFLTKAVLYKLFRDKGYTVVLEAESVHGVIDVVVVELGLAIEVAASCSPARIASKKHDFEELLIVIAPDVAVKEFCTRIKEQVAVWL